MRPDQLAINSISTRHRTLDEAFQAYAEAGFANVELHLPEAKTIGATETRRLLERHSLRSIGGFETVITCFAGPDERTRSRETLTENARFLDELDGGILVFGTDGPAEPTADALNVVVEALAELADSVSALNVTLALEFNWSPLIRSLESAIATVSAADRPNLGVLFDPAHYRTTVTKLEDLTPENVRWIKHAHFNDMNATPGDLANCNSDRVLPGEGILELARIIELLEEADYAGFLSIELFNEELWKLPVSEAAKRCYTSALRYCVPAESGARCAVRAEPVRRSP